MLNDFRTQTINNFKTAENSKKKYEVAMEELQRLSQIAVREKLLKKEKNVRNRNS